MHLTDVSDCHCVASHPVCPSLARPVYDTSPMLAPCTVIDVDPVPARFLRRARLSPEASTEHVWLTLPTRSPTVTTTRRVPPAPCPTLHLTDVSDSHCVASHPVCPSRILPECDTSPMLAPCTVTDAEPVSALFPRRLMLSIPISTDHTWVMLDPRSATVIATRRVPRAPCPV